MLAPNEPVSRCLKTEFTEEALGSLMDDEEQKNQIQRKLDELFSKGVEVRTNVLGIDLFWLKINKIKMCSNTF